jgi:RTX calcium-binding nonapeptide repeat (4 copies)
MRDQGYDGAVKRLAGIGAMAVIALALAASSAAADTATERPLAGGQSADDVRRFWTPERMRRATPLAAPQTSNAHAGADTPPRASTAAVEQPDTTAYPNRVVGRIFFRIPGEPGLFSCSGAVVNTDTDSLVFTAAHCVFENDRFFTNVNFVPGYRQGQRPFGEFPATELAVPAIVAGSPDLPLAFDHGSLLVAPTAGGQSAEDVVGSFGISLFGDPDQSWRAYGYPAEGAFDGERLFTCDSPTTTFDLQFEPPPIGIACDMTGGASGGPWVIQGTNLVGSNSSFIASDLPGTLFGPQLTGPAAGLIDAAHPVQCKGNPATIIGTEEADRLVGSSARDVILGDLGDDVVVGKGGKDKLCGEEGSDKVKGGKAKDFCDGGPGKDRGGGGCEKRKRL